MLFDRKDDKNFVRWAFAVKKRDHFICQICSRRGVELNAHHKNAWNWCEEERYSMDNGVTLCSNCHDQFHKIYGHGDNTEAQFEEFRIISEQLIKSINHRIRVEAVTKDVLIKLQADGYTSG